ncbi:MAG: type II toxin-antitoxin system Phd/YefM family antitoxin [Syntrophobacteraceae bacterium]
MRTLNIHEAKTNLSSVLAEIEEKGEAFVICRNGKPVAELVPYRHRNRLQHHPILSNIRIDYDPVENLSEEEWGGRTSPQSRKERCVDFLRLPDRVPTNVFSGYDPDRQIIRAV